MDEMYIEEIKMLLNLLPVSKFCWLCNISTRWYYTISKTMSRYEIYKNTVVSSHKCEVKKGLSSHKCEVKQVHTSVNLEGYLVHTSVK